MSLSNSFLVHGVPGRSFHQSDKGGIQVLLLLPVCSSTAVSRHTREGSNCGEGKVEPRLANFRGL